MTENNGYRNRSLSYIGKAKLALTGLALSLAGAVGCATHSDRYNHTIDAALVAATNIAPGPWTKDSLQPVRDQLSAGNRQSDGELDDVISRYDGLVSDVAAVNSRISLNPNLQLHPQGEQVPFAKNQVTGAIEYPYDTRRNLVNPVEGTHYKVRASLTRDAANPRLGKLTLDFYSPDLLPENDGILGRYEVKVENAHNIEADLIIDHSDQNPNLVRQAWENTLDPLLENREEVSLPLTITSAKDLTERLLSSYKATEALQTREVLTGYNTGWQIDEHTNVFLQTGTGVVRASVLVQKQQGDKTLNCSYQLVTGDSPLALNRRPTLIEQHYVGDSLTAESFRFATARPLVSLVDLGEGVTQYFTGHLTPDTPAARANPQPRTQPPAGPTSRPSGPKPRPKPPRQDPPAQPPRQDPPAQPPRQDPPVQPPRQDPPAQPPRQNPPQARGTPRVDPRARAREEVVTDRYTVD